MLPCPVTPPLPTAHPRLAHPRPAAVPPPTPAPDARAALARGGPQFGPRPAHGGPRPVVDGKHLAVGGERLWVRGVTYGTFTPESDPAQLGAPGQVEADFAAMVAHGINAVRTYTVPPRWVLDAALRHGLWVMVGLPWEQHVAFLQDRSRAVAIEARVREGVRSCAGHPAVLCFTVGNEIPAAVVRWHGRRRVEAFLKRLHRAVKQEDPGALATYVNFPSTEYLRLDFADFVCFNVYLEEQEKLEAYLARLQNLAGERPLVMAEVGLDSRGNGLATQARTMAWQLETAFGSGCAGAFVFAWTDEWHRGGCAIDGWDFGLTDRERRPKPALAAVERAFAEVPFAASAARPSVSVLVCTYNGSATLDECLEGVGRLRYPDYQVIVVDDGSTDDSAAIARRHLVRLIRTENRGLSAARNTALAAATGVVVAYIDDDACPDPDWLSYLVAALADGTHAGVGGPNLRVPGDGLSAEAVASAPGGPTHVLLSDTVAEHIPGCNMAFRRDQLTAIGGFDPRFRVAGDDVDVCWRVQARGWTLGFHPAAVVWHHRRGSLRRFWGQQRGYGRAEALLERKWPEKYNTPGHLTWAGRVYGSAAPPALRRSRVYYGTWGAEPFQSAHERPGGFWFGLASTPEWYLVIAGLAAITAGSALLAPLAVALPLLVVAVCLLLGGALRGAARADVGGAQGAAERVWVRMLTGLLFLVQPAARLTGRLTEGLCPWRRPGLEGFRAPRVRTERLWFEEWHSVSERMTSLEAALRARGARVRRGGAWDRWELQARAGALGGVRVRAVLEDHGAGAQLLRVRSWPKVSHPAQGLLVLLALLTVGGLAVGSWASAPAAAALVALTVFATFECGIASAATTAALQAPVASATPTEEHA